MDFPAEIQASFPLLKNVRFYVNLQKSTIFMTRIDWGNSFIAILENQGVALKIYLWFFFWQFSILSTILELKNKFSLEIFRKKLDCQHFSKIAFPKN